MPGNTADVLIVGGGVIGVSIAYMLSQRGISTIVFERDGLASGTAGATDGYITYHTKKLGIHLEIGMRSGSMFDALAEKLREDTGIDIEYDGRCGSMQLVDREEDWPYIQNMVEAQHAATGLDVAMYSIEELRKIEPALNPALLGGLYTPSAGKVNPFRLVFAMQRYAAKRGVRFYEGTRVLDLIHSENRVTGVRTEAGDFYGKYIVNAAGTWGGKIAAMADIHIPIRPRRGQILVTEPLQPMIHVTMQCARTTATKLNSKMLETLDPKIRKLGTGFCLEQTQDGSILIGFTREFAGFDKRTTLEAIELMAERAVKFIPALKTANIIRSYAGLRPYTPDGLPVLGFVPEMEGFVMAAGHEGDGICLAPLTGLMIAQLISGEQTEFPLEAFASDRFEHP